MARLFVPSDNAELRDRYEAAGRGGTCGVAAIAALCRSTVQEIIDAWVGGWPGYSPIRGMKTTLAALGYQARFCRGRKAKEFPFINCTGAIVRIQWLRDDGTDYPGFMERARHTHYVLLTWHDGAEYVFCNAEGWFPAVSQAAREYLRAGYISSYLEVSK